MSVNMIKFKEKGQILIGNDGRKTNNLTNSTNKKTGGRLLYINDYSLNNKGENKLVPYSKSLASFTNNMPLDTPDHINKYLHSQTQINSTDINNEEAIEKLSKNQKVLENGNSMTNNSNKQKSQMNLINYNFQRDQTNCKVNRNSSIGDRLAENSKQTKWKIQNKKIEIYLRILKNMSRSITQKSKNIKRNPKLIGEKLHRNQKICSKKSTCASINDSEYVSLYQDNDIYANDSIVSTHRKTQMNSSILTSIHQSNLNKNSFRITEKSEFPIEGLTKKKLKCRIHSNLMKVSDCFSKRKSDNLLKKNLSEGSLNNSLFNVDNSKSMFSSYSMPELNNSKLSQKSIIHSRELYLKGIELMNKKAYLYNEKKKNDLEYYKNFPFKPKISNNKRNLSILFEGKNNHEHTSNKCLNKNDHHIYEKNKVWKNNLLIRANSLKSIKEKQLIEECTFTPQIDKSIPQTDVILINRNLSQTNNYINKRRKVLMKKEVDKEYAEKKLNYGKNFKIKQTVPKEFVFHNSKSRRSKLSSNAPKLLHSASGILEMRKKLNIEFFFIEDNTRQGEVTQGTTKNNSACNDSGYNNNFLEKNSNPSKSRDILNTDDFKYYLSYSSKPKLQFRPLNEEKKETILIAVDKLNEKLLTLKYI